MGSWKRKGDSQVSKTTWHHNTLGMQLGKVNKKFSREGSGGVRWEGPNLNFPHQPSKDQCWEVASSISSQLDFQDHLVGHRVEHNGPSK